MTAKPPLFQKYVKEISNLVKSVTSNSSCLDFTTTEAGRPVAV